MTKLGNLKLDRPRVCFCISPGGKIKESEYGAADLLEYRADLARISSPGMLKKEMRMLKHHESPIILTNRRKEEGGGFQGDDEKRLHLMHELMGEADVIDLELASCRSRGKHVLDEAVEIGLKTIISHHDFEKTPEKKEIKDLLGKQLEIGDVAKAAFKTNEKRDILQIYEACLEVSEENPGQAVIAIPMGNPLGRITGALFKSRILYAGEVAKGQLSAVKTSEILEEMGLR